MLLDLTGEMFGKWTALHRTKTGWWMCRCECGYDKEVSQNLLRQGKSRGCFNCRETGHRRTHGGKGTRLYRIWQAMLNRCSNQNDDRYKDYGGRGITVCAEWRTDFAAFRNWAVSNGYDASLTIDREDNDGPYCPNNCRWANDRQQRLNKRNTRMVEFRGSVITLIELSERFAIPSETLWGRVRKGWDIEAAVREPVDKHRKRRQFRDARRAG